MEVAVLFFASLRSLAGVRQCRLAVTEGATVGGLFSLLAARYPGLESRRQQLVIAVNGEARSDEHLLADHDEVALLPPVSGGLSRAR